MATQTIYFKEHEGIAHNSTAQLSSWWGSRLGHQSVFCESFGQLKPLSMEHPGKGDQFTAIKQVELGAEHGTDKGNPKFTIFAGISSLLLIYAFSEEFFTAFVYMTMSATLKTMKFTINIHNVSLVACIICPKF